MHKPGQDGWKLPGIAGRALKEIAAFFIAYWQTFAAAFVAGVFLAFVGAFGTGVATLQVRILFWVPLLLFGTVIGQLIGLRTRRRPRIGENSLAVWAIVTVLVTAPVTLVSWVYTGVIFGGVEPRVFLYFLAAVGLVTGAVTAIMMLINRPGPATHAALSGAQRPAIRFLERMPEKLKGGAIYAVQAEDHYLRIRTSKGSDLILMRIADAIAELEGIEGAQTHRSWWVAKDGIATVNRAEGRVSLMLKDGAEAPVSRPNAKALRESGWL